MSRVSRPADVISCRSVIREIGRSVTIEILPGWAAGRHGPPGRRIVIPVHISSDFPPTEIGLPSFAVYLSFRPKDNRARPTDGFFYANPAFGRHSRQLARPRRH